MPVNWVALAVFVAVFGGITVLGFTAANWRRGDLGLLHEWGLAGGRFGTLVTWFLIGGDIYTAYTFIAVPALAFGSGAIAFFAVPYTTLIYPMAFVVLPRLWSVCKRHGYITAADFVRGRFGNRWLALAVAVTGLVATMPYIALQLVGLQVVIGAMGVETRGIGGDLPLFARTIADDLPLVIAFVVLALFTFKSGLRAPAAIAIVKDLMIYATIAAVLVLLPAKFGSLAEAFARVPPGKLILAAPPAGSTGQYSLYATLALGSAAALFLYPHAVTAVLSSAGRTVLRRNAVFLPAYSLVLAFITLLGFLALAAGVDHDPRFTELFARYRANAAVPALFLAMFPDWLAGFAFAAVGIGALVPAAIMSIAAANLWTRNIFIEFIAPNASSTLESDMAKWVSLIVKFGALLFIVVLPLDYAIQLQLLGGLWMSQTLPAVFLGLFSRWWNGWALLAGWAAGIGLGTWMAWQTGFKTANYALTAGGFSVLGYGAVWALLANILVAAALTLVANAVAGRERRDATVAADYA